MLCSPDSALPPLRASCLQEPPLGQGFELLLLQSFTIRDACPESLQPQRSDFVATALEEISSFFWEALPIASI